MALQLKTLAERLDDQIERVERAHALLCAEWRDKQYPTDIERSRFRRRDEALERKLDKLEDERATLVAVGEAR